jgi:phospholipid-binding lipoprotein MlaA
LLDPAGEAFGLHERSTDFGETLFVWGVGEGAFVEVPILGASTERDFAGFIVDSVFDPLSFVLTAPQYSRVRLATIGSKVSERLRYGESVNSVLHQSADSYAQLRLLYLQNRRFALGEDSDDDAFDPYEDPYGP